MMKQEEDNTGIPNFETNSNQKDLITNKRKRKKSLGQLCLKFISLFTKNCTNISLEQAAEMLSFSHDYHKIKTKIRRLYDIANVLQALHLIEKAFLPTRKPGFKWLGYRGFYTHFETNKTHIAEEACNAPKETQGKVFLVSNASLRGAEPQMISGPKYFKPRVLQLNTFPLVCNGKRIGAELEDKENIEFSKNGVFASCLRQVNSRIESKIQNKNVKKRMLLDSRVINLVS